MTTKTATFSIQTAKRVFAGPERTVEIKKGSHGPRRGCHVRFDNGWVVSIQWGPGNYITNRDYDFDSEARDSLDAEVAAWKGEDGDMLHLDGDSVAGWRSMDDVRDALDAASRDDEAGIVEALTRRREDDD